MQDNRAGGEYTDFEPMLQQYYNRLFPFQKIHRWLCASSKGTESSFAFREFSFTLPDDIYTRFQSFSTESDLQAKVCKLNPLKIDIGAIYSAKPCDRKAILNASAFQPLEKELVFDIDMTDYDDVRKCCKDKKICAKCWKFIAVAAEILDSALGEDFGFKHRLWVFSGRRGIHCWVCDSEAKVLDSRLRKATVSYLEVVKGGEEVSKRVHFPTNTLHPFIERSLSIIDRHFEEVILVEQDFLRLPADRAKVLAMIPDESLRDAIHRQWEKRATQGDDDADSREKWKILLQECNKAESLSSGKKNASKHFLKHLPSEIKFQLLFPRLDANVSMQINHLLKSPFCIHPDTWKVCVPLQLESIYSFDPEKAPSLAQLIGEIDQFSAASCNANDILKTSLKPYYDIFSKFVSKLALSSSLSEHAASTSNKNELF